MSKVNVYNKDGAAAGDVELPAVFATPVRDDLVRKAVKVARANRRQRYGANPVAGERHASRSIGKGKGASRVPRLTQGQGAALAPNVVGGRRAHPPTSRKDWSLAINKKERRLAIASALAATADGGLVQARGHKADGVTSFPVVVEDDLSTVNKTKELLAVLDKMGLGDDLERARTGRHIRAGMGKLRGRRYKTPKSVLFVTADGDFPAAANLTGVDVVAAKNLGAEHLAPGGDIGRLTVFTKSALDALGGES
ncbi:MAG: 50S ribosomal protein L4 [Thermoplasmatota archaeon]